MKANDIQKYNKKNLPALLKIATRHFNRFIRDRDKYGDYFKCISCGRTKRIEGNNYHACHYFPAGLYPWLRFDEDNVHGGCLQCNYFKHGAGYAYTEPLVAKIGEKRYEALLMRKDSTRGFKWDRFTIIDIILKYDSKGTKSTNK